MGTSPLIASCAIGTDISRHTTAQQSSIHPPTIFLLTLCYAMLLLFLDFAVLAALDHLGATRFYCKIGEANVASRALFDK